MPIVWLVSACLGAVLLIRIVLAVTDRAFDNTFRRIFTPNTAIRGGYPLDEFARMFWKSRLTQHQVDRILAAFPEFGRLLFPAEPAEPSVRRALRTGRLLDKLEAAMDREFANNGAQEVVIRYVIRKALFAAALDRELRRAGMSLDEIVDTGFIPHGMDGMMTNSVDEMLYQVFALPPKGTGGLDRSCRAVRLPVFMYDSVKLITEFVPTAGLRLMRPISRAKIATGDFSPLSREIIGTALFATALV